MSISRAELALFWQPKAVVFDLLSALLDSGSLWQASIPPGTKVTSQAWRQKYLEFTRQTGAYVPYEDLVKHAAHEVGLPPSASENLFDSWKNLSPWPETGGILRALRMKGCKLGVVTNCSKDLGHLAAHRAEKAASEEFTFDAIMTAEESGFFKPKKAAYDAILAAMGHPPGDVLFVAGSAEEIHGALSAGMRVVWHDKGDLTMEGKAVTSSDSRSLDQALMPFLY